MSAIIHSFHKDFLELTGRRADSVALITGRDVDTTEITYGELATAVRRCWALFDALGLAPNSTVMALMPNTADTLILFYAAMAAGINYAPVACTATASEVLRWIGLVKPAACFLTDLTQPELVRVLAERKIPVIKVTADGSLSWLPARESSRCGRGKIMLGTSGTTGLPKAMVIDGDVLWSSGKAFVDFHAMGRCDARFWNYLPVSYLGGLFNLGLIPMAAEGSVVMDEAFSGKTYLTYWQMVQRYGINTLWLVPTIVRGLVNLGRVVQRRPQNIDRVVQRCFLGTAPIDLATKREFEAMTGRLLLENFALSETTFLTSETVASVHLRSEGSVGEPLPYASLSFRPVTNEESGNPAQEIMVKTPFLFDGYLDEQGQVSKVLDEQERFATGDLGYLNAAGALVVCGRIRDIIKKGGYFIALREIELLAQSLPGVREAAAVPIRHDFYGESYVLFVVAQDAADTGLKERLARQVHEQLAQYRWPEDVKMVEALAKTSSGKVRKSVMAEQWRSK